MRSIIVVVALNLVVGASRRRIGLFIVEACEELADGTGLPLGRRPVDLVWGLTMIAAGIGFHDTGIDRKAFSLDQPGIHARPRHCLEQLPQDIAVTEAAVAID
jgi:hypothetical protein